LLGGNYFIPRNVWKELDVPVLEGFERGCDNSKASQHPVIGWQSGADHGHYADITVTRPNYELLVRPKMTWIR